MIFTREAESEGRWVLGSLRRRLFTFLQFVSGALLRYEINNPSKAVALCMATSSALFMEICFMALSAAQLTPRSGGSSMPHLLSG